MRSHTTKILSFIGLLVLLWGGCSGDQDRAEYPPPTPPDRPAAAIPPDTRKAAGEACQDDAECRSEFCDRDVCAEPGDYNIFGRQCKPPGPDARPVDKLPERLCGGYMCMNGRCQSCRSDGECQAYYGMGKCTLLSRSPSSVEEKRAACIPATTRRNSGLPCVEDAECMSLFCDHGLCSTIVYLGVRNYGETCEPGPIRPPPKDLRMPPTPGTCEGYLCIDSRCRSCNTDAECKAGSSDLKCIESFSDWPGKVCVSPSEEARHPPPVVPGGVAGVGGRTSSSATPQPASTCPKSP
jgi:hypothetical protein